MKYLFGILFVLLSGAVSAQNSSDSILEVRDKLIRKADEAALTTSEKKELVNIAFSLQNEGFELGESKHNYSNSLIYIESAIPIWVALKDTSMEANLYKFKGMLLGKLHRFEEAKKTIYHAIQLYSKIDQPSGVAVSKFDLAMVYDAENRMDSALFNAHLALEYWESEAEAERIFLIQNYLIYLSLKLGNINKAVELQFRNESIAKTTKLKKFFLMDYYFIACSLHEVLKNTEQKNEYWNLYQELSLELGMDLKQKYSLK